MGYPLTQEEHLNSIGALDQKGGAEFQALNEHWLNSPDRKVATAKVIDPQQLDRLEPFFLRLEAFSKDSGRLPPPAPADFSSSATPDWGRALVRRTQLALQRGDEKKARQTVYTLRFLQRRLHSRESFASWAETTLTRYHAACATLALMSSRKDLAWRKSLRKEAIEAWTELGDIRPVMKHHFAGRSQMGFDLLVNKPPKELHAFDRTLWGLKPVQNRARALIFEEMVEIARVLEDGVCDRPDFTKLVARRARLTPEVGAGSLENAYRPFLPMRFSTEIETMSKAGFVAALDVLIEDAGGPPAQAAFPISIKRTGAKTEVWYASTGHYRFEHGKFVWP